MLKRLNPSVSIGMWDLLDQIRPVASCLPCPSGSSPRTWAAVCCHGGYLRRGSLRLDCKALHFTLCLQGMLHRYSSKMPQILENRAGEAGVSQEGKAGKVPILLLVVLGCCCMGAGEVAGELRARV